MTPDKKRHLLRSIFTVIARLALLLILFRLWPLLLILLTGLTAYALWMLFFVSRQPVQAEPVPPPLLPAPISEQSVLTAAFSLLQRQITERVAERYPDARWVWGVSDAFGQFAAGSPLTILLNGAGGYRSAAVQIRNLQFAGLIYAAVPDPDTSAGPADREAPDTEETAAVDYGLLSFEWVEANLQRLNALSNETSAAGQDEFRIPAEELPHGDSWLVLCEELVRSGFTAAEPMADGIRVVIKTTSIGE